MSARKAAIDKNQVTFSFVGAQMIDLGGGDYKFIPGKPVEEMNVPQMAKRLGISVRKGYELVEDGTIPCRRPSPHKILILAADVEKHYAATRDPEFWSKKKKP